MTPILRLFPPARLRACRFGWYLSSSTALMTRARVVLLTSDALFRTRETVAVETRARFATCSRFMSGFHSTRKHDEMKVANKAVRYQQALAIYHVTRISETPWTG